MSVLIDIMQSLAIIFLVVGGFFLLSRVRDLAARPTTATRVVAYKSEPEPEAVCGCEHHHCFHDEDGCGHVSQVQTFDVFKVEHYKAVRCKCKRYTGPEPLPQVIP